MWVRLEYRGRPGLLARNQNLDLDLPLPLRRVRLEAPFAITATIFKIKEVAHIAGRL